MAGEESEDLEALVPSTRAIFGLKVADADEARTVSRVGMATLGFSLLLALDFVVHLIRDINAMHWLSHLVLPTMLLTAGSVAVVKRSPRAAWIFHVGSVLLGLTHAVLLAIVALSLFYGDTEAAACSIRKHCPDPKAATGTVAWFIIVSAPVIVLCLYSAYHSQDFYMQLRLRQFLGHTDNRADNEDASVVVVFEQGGPGERCVASMDNDRYA